MSGAEIAQRPALHARPHSPGTSVTIATRMAGLLSIMAGAMHAKAMADHVAHWWFFGVFFGVLACAQFAWGVRVYVGGAGDRLLLAGAAGSLVVVAIWIISRVVGVPAGPWAGDAEPVGAMDLVASLDELVIVAFVAAALRPQGKGLGWLHGAHAVRLGIALGTLSLFAALVGGHSH